MMRFPRSLVHGSGARMTLDPRRILVAFKEDQDPGAVEALLRRANATLERASEPKGRQGERALVTINHTPRHFWVRLRSAAAAAALERLLQGRLEWIGPVYMLERTRGLEGLVCPLPNVLLIRPASPSDPSSAEGLGRAMERLGLKEVPEKSRYLNGARYFEVADPSRHSAYEIRESIMRREKDLVADVRFENMPLLGDTTLVPNDAFYAQQWNLTQIQAAQGWDYGTGNASVVVAILDDGVETGHPDLNCLPGINLSTMMPTGNPGGSHGTACAGIAAASLNNALGVAGVGGGCTILPLRRVTSSDVEAATGINWAADNGAHVISMSFGRYALGEGFGPTGWDFTIIDPAIEHAWNEGVVLCAASGNENTGTVNRYPARHPLVIACGASDQADNRKSPASPDGENWGSNFGQQIYDGITTGVSVVAPGVLIPTTDRQGANGYNGAGGAAGNYFMMFNGTSSATPHVAGLAALLLSEKPSLTNMQVRSIIEKTADKVGPVAYAPQAGFPNGTRNKQMGYGRINAYRALKAVQKTLFKDLKDAIVDKPLLADKPWVVDTPKGNRWKEKEAIEEVKGMVGFENPELVDPRILVQISARLERLEKEVFKGRAFIRRSERPEVGAGSATPGS